jgi:thiamine biosynthesis lipoprotein
LRALRFIGVLGVLSLGRLFAAEVDRAWFVMGTSFRVLVEASESSTAETAAASIHDEVSRWDRLLSTYRDDSEISRLNAAAPRAVAVSTDTRRIIERALDWSRRTGGVFDPTIGPWVRAWGFQGGTPRVPSREERRSALARVGVDRVVLAEGTARLSVEGMSLDFGAIGKGWAMDQALERLDRSRLDSVALDFGGQWLFWSREERRWPAAVRGGTVTFSVPAGSLATSSSFERFFTDASGRRWGHILDPRTGYPSREPGSVTVWSPRATDADVLSTALHVRGRRRGLAWAARRGIAALFVGPDGRADATPDWRRITQFSDKRPSASDVRGGRGASLP